MPQSLAKILVHVVFSTKNRELRLKSGDHAALYSYIGGIVKSCDGDLLKAGAVEDHIHLLIAHPRTHAPAKLIQEIKTGSSKWLKMQNPANGDFHWQSGYGIFSVSPSHRQAVEEYLSQQAEHHKTVSFQEEYRRLLHKYEIEFDERYVWD